MKTLYRRIEVFACVTVLCLVGSGAAWALGFRNPDQDARATAQGEAFVAQADSPSAIYYNPAGLTQLKGTQFSGGGLVTTRDIQFHGTAANESLTDPAFTGHAYGVTDANTEKFRLGLGVNVPFGNAEDWGEKGTFRYMLTKTSLRVVNIQPTAAYKVNDHLSVGAGLNYYNGDTELRRLVPFSILFFPLPVPDGRFKFEGDGDAIGATAGVLYRINDQHALGVVYRSPFSIDFDGHVVVKRDATGALGRSPAKAEIDFPQSVAAGYAFRPIEKLKLEVDVEWTGWETLDVVRLRSPNAAFATDPNSKIPFNWLDSLFYEFGTQYDLNEHWALRAGYIYSQNSVPNNTFAPTLPDSDRHIFSVGVGFASTRFGVDVAYQYSLSTDRTVKRSADTNFDGAGDVDGKWDSQGHAVIVTSTVKF